MAGQTVDQFMMKMILQMATDLGSVNRSKIEIKGIDKAVKQLGLSVNETVSFLKNIKVFPTIGSLGQQIWYLSSQFKNARGEVEQLNFALERTGKVRGGREGFRINAATRSKKGDIDKVYGESPKDLKDLEKATDSLTASKKRLTGSISALIDKSIKIVPIWMMIRFAYQSFLTLLSSSFKFMIDWESLLAKIKIVADESSGSITQLSKDLLALGESLGVSAEDLAEGARLWAQQGKNFKDIIPLMKTTAMMSKLTGRSMADSVEDLTSAMYSFGMTAEDTEHVVDSLVAVDMKYAVTTDVLVSAIRKVGPVANQMGISFEKMLGIITATHLATRASGDEIGNSWKTIFTRMTTNAIPAIQNLADVPVYMDAAGKATKDNTGTFRNWEDVISDLAEKFPYLEKSIQSALAVQISGVRQITKLQAFLQQYKEAIGAAAVATNSAGAAQKAYNIWLGTTAGKIDQVKGAWNELVGGFDDNQGLKNFLDLIRNIINDITDFTNSETFRLFTSIAKDLYKADTFARKTLRYAYHPPSLVNDINEEIAKKFWNKKSASGRVDEALKKTFEKVYGKGVPAPATPGVVLDEEQLKLEFQKLDALKEYGFTEEEIAQKKLDRMRDFDKVDLERLNQIEKELNLQIELGKKKTEYSNFLKDDELVQKRLEGLGYNKLQLAVRELEKFKMMKELRLASAEEILEKEREILRVIQDEVNAYSKALQDSISGNFSDFLKGEKSFSQFGSSVASTVKDSVLDAFSQGATEKLFTSTGLGGMFGDSIFQIKHLFDRTPKNLGDLIYQSHVNGIVDGFNRVKMESAAGTASGALGQGSLGKNVGMVANAALIGYSAYQSARSAGRGKGTSYFAGALGAGGSIATATGHPEIGAILTVGSMLFGMFKKSVDVQEETKEEIKQVSSKIQISNKELEVVNRNLIALRNEKTFILPESAYFSQKNTLEDEFGLHASRGLIL